MLLQAAKDFNIDLSQSYMIGDGENDMLAGEQAVCKVLGVGTIEGYPCKDSLLECIDSILKEERYV